MSHTPESMFLLHFTLLHTRLARKADNTLSMIGLSLSQYQILHSLGSVPNKTLSRIQLAESVGLSASGVTRLLAPMEKLGMVEKDSNPRDARMSLVKLSRGGERLYRDGTALLVERAAAMTRNLTTAQFEKLRQFTEQLV